MKDKLRALGRRWPWFGRALDVQDRMGEINGGFAASAITVTFFISIFPLLLVVIAIVGYVAAGNDDLAADLIEKLGLTGPGAETLDRCARQGGPEPPGRHHHRPRRPGVGRFRGGRGAPAGRAPPWQERSNGIQDRLLGMAWLAAAAIGFAVLLSPSGVLQLLPDWAPAPWRPCCRS